MLQRRNLYWRSVSVSTLEGVTSLPVPAVVGSAATGRGWLGKTFRPLVFGQRPGICGHHSYSFAQIYGAASADGNDPVGIRRIFLQKGSTLLYQIQTGIRRCFAKRNRCDPCLFEACFHSLNCPCGLDITAGHNQGAAPGQICTQLLVFPAPTTTLVFKANSMYLPSCLLS